ncbi:unnamed protein product [Symbiodinium pilosum]|uniref:Uncharacterized protein n=1 Tax=Symbiodinium pilosum TaxID=2952 RepID=A0A812XNI3_SYMPI|nr:unnamed protein product [Symbiodinium pilosum]
MPVKVLCMATVGNDELQRAAEELSSFASFMTPLATPTQTTAPSLASTEMPVDQSSKRDGEDEPGPEESRAKWHRGQGKGAQQNQRAKGRPQQQSWWEKEKSDKYDNKSNSKHDDLKQAVKALGRLVLRQEDSLAVMQLDCQFIIFMKNTASESSSKQIPDWIVTKQMLTVGNHWRDRKAKDPKSLGQPLRTVLFSSWLTAMKFRIDDFQANPSQKEVAVQMGILGEDGFPYLQWDPETSKHVKIQQEPLSIEAALQILQQLQTLIVHPNVIGRFHPLRKLTENMVSDVIPWTIEIQNRTQEAQAAYSLIGRLIRSGCTHLAASTLRPCKLGRSPLATAVDKMIQEL